MNKEGKVKGRNTEKENSYWEENIREISWKEMENATKSTSAGKAPGPDKMT